MINIVTQTIDDLLAAVGPLRLLHEDLLRRALVEQRAGENDSVSSLRIAFALSHLKWCASDQGCETALRLEVASDLNAYLLNEQPYFTEECEFDGRYY